jgi:hypothetical protein
MTNPIYPATIGVPSAREEDMQKLDAIRWTAFTAAFAIALLIAVDGCSSSTEPRSHIAADGLAVHLDVSPNPAIVHYYVNATLTIENTTSDTVTRTYPPGDVGPRIRVTNGNGVLQLPLLDTGGFFGPFFQAESPSVFTLAPHEKRILHVRFVATAVGPAELTGCLTKGDANDTVCVDTFVTVQAH